MLLRVTARLLGLLILFNISLSSLAYDTSTGTPPPLPRICSESDRFGVAVAGSIQGYDVGLLHAGWYHNFTVNLFPPRPAGMDYVQTIRLSDDGPFADRACSACPTWQVLDTVAQANPGSVWIIGNEQDRQDYVKAARYVELYHEFYNFLKAHDPAGLVGIGGVVQSTPIRLQYLDMILEAYEKKYKTKMPVDVWNVHDYVLREGIDGWGCGIPPETDPSLAEAYGINDHDNLEYWTGHLIELRKWMRDRGYQDRPLIVTEFGILMPELYGYDYTRVRDFMLATFDWMMTATDPSTGYPADGNRLVQAWAWYSLNDPAFEGYTSWNHLFNPDTFNITRLGQQYAAYTAPLTDPFPGSIDLEPVAIWHAEPQPPEGNPVSMTVMAEIQNNGGTTANNVVVRFERDGVHAGDVILPSIAPGESQIASIVWTNLGRGDLYEVTVIADPNDQFTECDPFNNTLSIPMLVTDIRTYLPLVAADY